MPLVCINICRFTPNLLWKIDGDAKSLKIIETDARGLVFKGFTLYVGSMYLVISAHHISKAQDTWSYFVIISILTLSVIENANLCLLVV